MPIPWAVSLNARLLWSEWTCLLECPEDEECEFEKSSINSAKKACALSSNKSRLISSIILRMEHISSFIKFYSFWSGEKRSKVCLVIDSTYSNKWSACFVNGSEPFTESLWSILIWPNVKPFYPSLIFLNWLRIDALIPEVEWNSFDGFFYTVEDLLYPNIYAPPAPLNFCSIIDVGLCCRVPRSWDVIGTDSKYTNK